MPAREVTPMLDPLGMPKVIDKLSEQTRAFSPSSPSQEAFAAGYVEGYYAMQAVVAAQFNDAMSKRNDAEQVHTAASCKGGQHDLEDEDAPPPPPADELPPPPPDVNDPPPPPPDDS